MAAPHPMATKATTTLKPSPTVGPWSLGVTLTIPSVLRVGGGALIAMKRLQGAGGARPLNPGDRTPLSPCGGPVCSGAA